ncbi:MAG: hypothetical protein H6697_03055 [Myxococcales bacterium]|nr:hypothetical protein [Myxococcales bacterium]MCB9520687.1 hypothetical protein [Myxococcales bacterium]
MKKLALALPLLVVALAGCSSDAADAFNVLCRTSSDCASGLSCSNGVCVDGRGTGGRGGGTLDAGGVDTSAVSDAESDAGGGGTDTIPSLDIGGCTPSCGTATCGDDGCGGSCGACSLGQSCVSGQCETAGGAGTSCSDIIGCINDCAGNDDACWTACINDGTPTAQRDIAAVLTCLDTNCGDVPQAEFQACQQDNCGEELRTCNGVMVGSDDCTAVFTCLVGCPDQTCGDACIDEGTIAAQDAAIALYNCGVDNCADGVPVADWVACVRAACATEATACDSN